MTNREAQISERSKRRIAPGEIEIGMHVVSFGGSWLDHPFWRGNFVVKTFKECEKIAGSRVRFVEIDEALGEPAGQSAPDETDIIVLDEALSPEKAAKRKLALGALRSIQMQGAPRRKAKAVLSRSQVAIRQIFTDVWNGWKVEPKAVETVLDDILGQVEDDLVVLVSVAELKSFDDYTYLHSVVVCALMASIAKHRGYEAEEVRELAVAGLLHDIGKIKVPDDVLNKPGRLTEDEYEQVKLHAQHGFDLLCDSAAIPKLAPDVCLHHHERVDGKGYPLGLAGDDIPFAARMGAVCDVFDALISPRPYKPAMSHQEALTKMWSWEGHFDRDSLVDLMMVMHTFAIGALLRLSDDTLAVALEMKPGLKSVRALRIHSIQDASLIDAQEVGIAYRDRDLQVIAVERPEDWGLSDWEDDGISISAGP